MNLSCCLPFALALAACSGRVDGPDTDASLHELTYTSSRIDQDFVLYTAVPPGASEDSPVVFVLDGDNFFWAATGWETEIRVTRETEPAVVVGIGYGVGNAYFVGCKTGRWRDLSIIPEGRCLTGEADTFVDVLITELVPRALEDVPGNPDRLALWGHSLGGRVALWTALTRRNDPFSGFVAVDGAAPEIIDTQDRLLTPGAELPVKLFHMFGGQIAQEGQDNFDNVNQRFEAADLQGFEWTTERPDADHRETMALGLERGLGWVLSRL